MRAYAKVVFR